MLLTPETYRHYTISFFKYKHGNYVQAAAYNTRTGKAAAACGGKTKEDAFEKIKRMIR